MRLRIGTRGSALARTQATTIAAALAARGHDSELVIVRTAGDASTAAAFGSIGPQGVFVREIEQALLDGEIDMAVHSYKDLPTASSTELTVAAVPLRLDPADALIIRPDSATRDGGVLPVKPGAAIGTSSARRQLWLEHLRPDVRPGPLRGNVPTRIKRLKDGDFDAILLAAAGIERLEAGASNEPPALDLDDLVVVRLDPDVFVPAPAQGALALQCRCDADEVRRALEPLNDVISRGAVDAERALLAQMEGGCELALGAYCENNDDQSVMIAMVERNGQVLHETLRGADPPELAAKLWRLLSRD